MVAVPVTVDDAYSLFPGVCRGFEPTRRLIKRCVINADRHGDISAKDRERKCLTVNRRGVRRGSRLRSCSDNRWICNDRTVNRRRGISQTCFPRVERHPGRHIGAAGNGWVNGSGCFGRYFGRDSLRRSGKRMVDGFVNPFREEGNG